MLKDCSFFVFNHALRRAFHALVLFTHPTKNPSPLHVIAVTTNWIKLFSCITNRIRGIDMMASQAYQN